MKRNILVTGGCGFIGSNFIKYYFSKYKDFIVNLDKLTYAADLNNTNDFKDNKNYKFIKGNICNRDLLSFIFKEYNITDVINFAAETHVDNSIKKSFNFITSNIVGVSTLLNVAKDFWTDYKKNVFLQISTDEVYGSTSLISKDKWREDSILNPRNPYSASKASAEHMCMAFYNTYGFPVIITRSSNNFGPYQNKEKFLPVIINNLINNKEIPIYGKGDNIREWTYVLNNCDAISNVLFKGKVGEIYNISSNIEYSNKNFVELVIKIYCDMFSLDINKYKKLITYVDDRKGHDLRYAMYTGKIEKELGWKSNFGNSFYNDLQTTIMWYCNEVK